MALQKEGEVGTLEKDMLADILVVDGDPLEDITVLGDKSKLEYIFLGGKEIDQTIQPSQVNPVSGWRLSPYSNNILTQEVSKEKI